MFRSISIIASSHKSPRIQYTIISEHMVIQFKVTRRFNAKQISHLVEIWST